MCLLVGVCGNPFVIYVGVALRENVLMGGLPLPLTKKWGRLPAASGEKQSGRDALFGPMVIDGVPALLLGLHGQEDGDIFLNIPQRRFVTTIRGSGSGDRMV